MSVSEAPITGKRLELLKEIAPRISRVLVLALADAPAQLVQRDAALTHVHFYGPGPKMQIDPVIAPKAGRAQVEHCG